MNKTFALGVIALVSVLIASTYFVQQSNTHTLITRDQAQVYTSFKEWMSKHTRNYRQVQEQAYRFLKYRQNYYFVKNHNNRYAKGLQTFNVSLNHFADMDNIQFSAIHLKKRSKDFKKDGITTECKTKLTIKTDLPESWDWADKAVAPVRNQGNCGSCWAFSATGALQGLSAIKSGKIQVFSPQQLVDCAGGKYGNQGCNGGQMDAAFWYVIDNGISLDSKYPYTARDGKCAYKPDTMKAFSITDCAQIQANKSIALKSAVYTQPVAIAVQADTAAFQFYNHGVFSGKCGTDLDHGITLTGYGNINGVDFWKCKNSWGAGWGLAGYIMIARSDADGPGQCGILMDNAVPLLA